MADAQFDALASGVVGAVWEFNREAQERRFEENKAKLWAFMEKEGRLPNRYSKDVEEKRLYSFWTNVTSPSHDMYRERFREETAKKFPNIDFSTGEDRFESNKAKLWAFIEKEGRLPSRRSEDAEEKRLANFWMGITNPSHDMYREGFREETAKKFPNIDFSTGEDRFERNKAKLRAFMKKEGRLPDKYSKDAEEKRPALFWMSVTSPSHNSYRKGFREELTAHFGLTKVGRVVIATKGCSPAVLKKAREYAEKSKRSTK